MDLERGLRAQGTRASLDGYIALTDTDAGTDEAKIVLFAKKKLRTKGQKRATTYTAA